MIELENPPIGRRTFVYVPWRPGANFGGLVEYEKQLPTPRVHLQSDHHDPFRCMVTGEMRDSKSVYRAEIKARGFEEVGNEKSPFSRPEAPKMPPVEQDIMRAAEEIGFKW